MSLVSAIAGAASVLLAAVLCGSPEGRRLVRRTWAAAVETERRHHVFSTGITFVVLTAALCAGAVLLFKALIDALLGGLLGS
jgi:hypothetical protein